MFILQSGLGEHPGRTQSRRDQVGHQTLLGWWTPGGTGGTAKGKRAPTPSTRCLHGNSGRSETQGASAAQRQACHSFLLLSGSERVSGSWQA